MFRIQKKKDKRKQSRCWVFTFNNPKYNSTELLDIIRNWNQFRFAVFQLEEGDSGTLHFQGYLQFNKAIRKSTLLKRLPHCWFKMARGSPEQNIAYCSKEPRMAETKTLGKFKKQGSRTDIVEFRDKSATHTARYMLDYYPHMMAKHQKFYKFCAFIQFKHHHIPNRQVILCIGDTDTGKTQWAREYGDDYWVQPIATNQWFDGYDRHEIAIFDDYGGDGTMFRLKDLLRLTHDWSEIIPIKGGFAPWCPQTIIFTANEHPGTWYNLHEDREKRYLDRTMSYKALARRFTMVYLFTENVIYPIEEGKIMDFFLDTAIDFETHGNLPPPIVNAFDLMDLKNQEPQDIYDSQN